MTSMLDEMREVVPRNYLVQVKVLCPKRGVRVLELIHIRRDGEAWEEYLDRYLEVQRYAEGTIGDIERIQAVQLWLLCQGYGLSNTILLEVGVLQGIPDKFRDYV